MLCLTNIFFPNTYMPTLKKLKAVGGRGGSGNLLFQKDAKWCILLHFGYKICEVKTLNILVWKNWFFFKKDAKRCISLSEMFNEINSSVHAVLNTSGISDIFIQTLISWCLGIIHASSKCSASKLYFKYRFWFA